MADNKLGTGGVPGKYQQAKIGLELFDLESDIGETENIADQHPKVVGRLSKLADKMRAELGDQGKKGVGVREVGRL